jgi:hypothetical protein
MEDAENVSYIVNSVSDRFLTRARAGMRKVVPLIEARLGEPMQLNEQMWTWTWMQYIQAVVVSSCKRRSVLQSRWL